MPKREGHRWFAAFFDYLVRHEPRSFSDIRKRVVPAASGQVLEIGCGPGANFRYYPPDARVVATDPDPFMLRRARQRAKDYPNVELREAAVEELPFPDNSFDTVICSFVLCSVDSPQKGLAEMRRVLKPGGELRFVEHVRYPGGVGSTVQKLINPVWGWMSGGCQLDRDTEREIREAGFSVTEVSREMMGPIVDPSRPIVIGIAAPD
jgi:ubiquinone/menaquinone biosynthesis C-methylase UbiE